MLTRTILQTSRNILELELSSVCHVISYTGRKVYNLEPSDDREFLILSLQISCQVPILGPWADNRHKQAETVCVTKDRQNILVLEFCACS